MGGRPLQNRVNPWGRLEAVGARGLILGNRGCLHGEAQNIVSQWQYKAWIYCRLQWEHRRREVFAPGRYSELFFLDEATALSAGHRPCFECCRSRLEKFRFFWASANPRRCSTPYPRLAEIDAILHGERVAGARKQASYAKWRALPSGVFVAVEGESFLIWNGRPHRWSFWGYSPGAISTDTAEVLTPRSVVRAFAAGFLPDVHPSLKAPVGALL